MSEKLNICLATAADFEVLLVAVKSILLTKNTSTEIEFHFLVSNDFTLEARKCLESLCIDKNVSCNFYVVGDMFRNAKTHIPGISTPTYYRLIIPTLLKNQKKCLYLDADIVVMHDLTELYSINIAEYMIAGVYALAYHQNPNNKEYCLKSEIPDIDSYVNAGVLLMNLEKLREASFVDNALRLIPMQYESQDQDIINKLCYGRIKILPFKYNVMTKYYGHNDFDFENLYKKEEMYNGWADATIIHYADKRKPWQDFSAPFAQYWWYFCKKSPAWEYWRERASDEFIYRSLFDKNKNCIISNLYQLKKNEPIMIFGAGNVAKKIIWKLTNLGFDIETIIVTDKNKNPNNIEGIKVNSIYDIANELKFRPIIIAVQECFKAEVIGTLWENGFIKICVLEDDILI